MSQEQAGENPNAVVLDASAILAVIFDEPGAENVLPHLPTGCVSTVNLAEVATVALRRGADLSQVREFLARLPLDVIPFTAEHAYQAAALEPHQRKFNLSLGDRACLATAVVLDRPVVTAERGWVKLPLSVPVTPIR